MLYILTKDIRDVTEIRKIETMRRVSRRLFAHSAQFISINELAAKSELAKVTLQNYIEALKALYVIDAVPAWTKSDYEMIGKREKMFATDSSLVANILGWSEDEANAKYAISHYRDGKKREIDFIVERTDGALLGIEVKSGAVGTEDFKHLKWFAGNLAGERQFTGIVLYAGDHTLRFGEGFYAVPLAALGA